MSVDKLFVKSCSLTLYTVNGNVCRHLAHSPICQTAVITTTHGRTVTVIYFVELLSLTGFSDAVVVADVSLLLHAAVL